MPGLPIEKDPKSQSEKFTTRKFPLTLPHNVTATPMGTNISPYQCTFESMIFQTLSVKDGCVPWEGTSWQPKLGSLRSKEPRRLSWRNPGSHHRSSAGEFLGGSRVESQPPLFDRNPNENPKKSQAGPALKK